MIEKGRKAVVIGHNLVKSPFAWDFSVDAQRASKITQNPSAFTRFSKGFVVIGRFTSGVREFLSSIIATY
jgi:hypothetical protein